MVSEVAALLLPLVRLEFEGRYAAMLSHEPKNYALEREVRTLDVTARVRLTKTPEQYLTTREQRRELPYEATLASGRSRWIVGERLRMYRAAGKRAALLPDPEEGDGSRGAQDPRDYDVDYSVRVLAETFGARLFPKRLADARPILTVLESAP